MSKETQEEAQADFDARVAAGQPVRTSYAQFAEVPAEQPQEDRNRAERDLLQSVVEHLGIRVRFRTWTSGELRTLGVDRHRIEVDVDVTDLNLPDSR